MHTETVRNEMAVLILNEIDIKLLDYRYFTIIKVSINQGDMTTIHLYSPNNNASKYKKQN